MHRTAKRLCLALAAGGIATAAQANADYMKPRFDNTMISVTPDGHVNRLRFKADSTLTGRYDSTDYTGTWTVEGDRVCVRIEPNRPGRPNPNCVPLLDRRVGQAWVNPPRDSKMPGGVEMLVEGIQ
jgi:hypothetical protein